MSRSTLFPLASVGKFMLSTVNLFLNDTISDSPVLWYFPLFATACFYRYLLLVSLFCLAADSFLFLGNIFIRMPTLPNRLSSFRYLWVSSARYSCSVCALPLTNSGAVWFCHIRFYAYRFRSLCWRAVRIWVSLASAWSHLISQVLQVFVFRSGCFCFRFHSFLIHRLWLFSFRFCG
jgi:hypothetical protein